MTYSLRVQLAVCLIVLVAHSHPADAKETAAAKTASSRTALDDYIAMPDASYRWKIVNTISHPGGKTFILDMVSQSWRSSSEVDRTEWQHWLVVTVPDKIQSEIAFLMIGGGGNGGEPPKGPSDILLEIAHTTGAVVAELKMVPNQPLVFHQDGQKRVEDDLIGYTWDQFLKTGDPTWPARNPMAKSAVRAMDTLTALLASEQGGRHRVDQFVVAGGSKRGWTTWITAAMDDRVVAIVPIVIDVLNVKKSMLHHHAAYGFWSPAVGDYVAHRIMERMEHPRMAELYDLIDPYAYRHRLTMPKMIVNASGDQFFLPDSSRFYFDELPGEKHLRYVPNADHGLDDSDAVESIAAFYWMIVNDRPRPEFTWDFQEDGSIRVKTADTPKQVLLWQATNPDARDFRLETLGPKYTSRALNAGADGTYVGRVAQPEKGWTAFFVELTYDVGAPVPIKFTTSVRVLPDILPYADKDGTLPGTIALDCQAPDETTARNIEQKVNLLFQAVPTSDRLPPWMAGLPDALGKDLLDALHPGTTPWGRVRRSGRKLLFHWKPLGRIRLSAMGMTSWLKKQGCQEFAYRLKAGLD
jgi:PhoPQ-activated pathogenicity-related protein